MPRAGLEGLGQPVLVQRGDLHATAAPACARPQRFGWLRLRPPVVQVQVLAHALDGGELHAVVARPGDVPIAVARSCPEQDRIDAEFDHGTSLPIHNCVSRRTGADALAPTKAPRHPAEAPVGSSAFTAPEVRPEYEVTHACKEQHEQRNRGDGKPREKRPPCRHPSVPVPEGYQPERDGPFARVPAAR